MRSAMVQAVARITSDALITAVTWLPSARPSSRTASTVMDATRRIPFASRTTLAIASPALIAVTVAGIWFRALSGIVDSRAGRRDEQAPRYRVQGCAYSATHPMPGFIGFAAIAADQ